MTALVAAGALAVQGQGRPVNLTALLDTYYQGRRDEAVASAVALPDLGPLRLQFVQGTPTWINADPSQAEQRRAAVAGFLVELAGARLESDWGRLSDLIEWTCAQLLRPPSSGPGTWPLPRWPDAPAAGCGCSARSRGCRIKSR
jgi:hypothetical protein